MPSGGGGVYGAPPAIVYQSTDPYAANYKPPTGPQLSPAQKAGQQAKANATPLEANPDDEEERRRRLALILGSGAETWGGGDGSSSGAADAGAGDSSGAADGSAY
jgi:hypothetical protein